MRACVCGLTTGRLCFVLQEACIPHAQITSRFQGARKMIRLATAVFTLLLFFPTSNAQAASICDPDGVQSSGSKYRICMPAEGEYNGMLVIWAHGFQDAGTPVGIPEDQLCVNDFCIPEILNGLGFGFATNSYSKTGLAVLQGKDDIIDLVDLYTA